MSQKRLSLPEAVQALGSITPGNNLPIIMVTDPKTGVQVAKMLKEKTHYVKVWLNQITARGGELLKEEDVAAIGIRSINGNKLPAGADFFVTDIRATFETTAASQAAGIPAAAWDNKAPAVFLNGDVTISQGVELFASSGFDICNNYTATGNDDDFRAIRSPFLLKPQVAISIRVLPGGTVAADQGLNLELRGFELIDAINA